MNVELLTIYTLSVDGTSYTEFLVGGSPVELVEYSYTSERMGATTLTATVRSRECLDTLWTGREFVVLDEGALRSAGVSAVEKFFLAHVPSSSKSNEDERYVHSLEFRAGRDILLSGVYFCDAVSGGSASASHPVSNSYDVKFIGTLDEFVQRFNDVLSYRGLSGRFSVSLEAGVAGTTESKEISFSGATLAEALGEAVEVWGVPFYFLGDSAVFGRADAVPLTAVEYGHDEELLSVSMNNRGEKVVTRIMGVGGTENVPYYYPNPSPKGTLGVGGTAAGVTIRDMVLFSQAVGQGDVLVYTGRSADFGGVTLHFGGFTAESAPGSPTAVVDGQDHYGVDVLRSIPFDASVTADLSGGFDRGVDVLVTALLGSAEGISPDTELYYVKKMRPFAQMTPDDYVKRLRGEVSSKGWTPFVERVEVVAGGVTVQVTDFEGIYADAGYGEADAGLYPERRLLGVRVDLGAALSLLPSGTSLTSCVVRLVGTLRSEVLWQIPDAQGQWHIAEFHVASLSVTGVFDPCGWYNGDIPVGDDLSAVGLTQSGSPVVGTTVTQTVLGYVTPTGCLMPTIYRTSGGAERAYEAEDGTYINPETGQFYTFENQYDALHPHEHIENFGGVYPSIRNLQDGQGNPLNVVTDVWFDDGYNVRDLLPDGETLKYQYFFVKLKPLGFNLFDCATESGEMAVVMDGGACAGCHFKILVTSDGKNPVQKNNNGTLKKEGASGHQKGVIDPGNIQAGQQDTTSSAVWVALYLDGSTFGGGEYGTMPAYDKASGAGAKPVSGDAYVLENILLPQAFFTAAEQELDRRLIRFMWENNADKFDPSVVFSRIWLAQHPSVRAALSERSRLSLTYDGRVFSPLYVSQFTINVKEGEPLPEILVETADIVEQRTSGLDEKISSAVDAAVNVVMGGAVGGADLEETDRRYLRKDAEDTAQEKIVFSKGLEVGAYKAGLAGIGGTIYTNAAGEAIAEVDFLSVRRKATFTQVEVESLRKVNGTILLSLADVTLTAVEKVSGGWKCSFKTDAVDGSAIKNAFAAGDQAICRKLQSTDDHYWWRLVTAVGADYVVLSESDCDAGSDEPRVGDVAVQLGNRSDAARQSAQILSCYGTNSPSYVIYAGINSYSLAGKDISGFEYRETSPGSGVYNPYFFNYGPMLLGDRNKTQEYVEFDGSALNIKGRLTVRKNDGTYQSMSQYIEDNDVAYLKAATNDGTTLVDGGLILSNLMALGQTVGQQFQINAGINGIMNAERTRLGGGIAAWFGGGISDKDDLDTGVTAYAKSIFRFDGSGYLAGGNIHWDSQGYGGIPGITWSRPSGSQQDVITIGANVMLESMQGSDSSVTDLITLVRSVSGMFVDETYTEGGQTKHRIKVNTAYSGFYSDGFISAGGLSPGGGSAGGNANLVAQTYGGTLSATGISPINFYSKEKVDELLSVAGAIQTVAGVSPVSGDIPVDSLKAALSLGAAAAYGVGSVASGNNGLVTGGSVYSAINDAITSALKFQGVTTTAISDGSTTNPITINGSSYTAKKGDVVLYGGKEFLWTGSAWEQLGDEASWALKTTTISAGTGLTGGGSLASNRTISLSQATQDSIALANSALQPSQIYGLTLKINKVGAADVTIGSYTPTSAASTLTISSQNIYDAIGSEKYHPYGGGESVAITASNITGKGNIMLWNSDKSYRLTMNHIPDDLTTARIYNYDGSSAYGAIIINGQIYAGGVGVGIGGAAASGYKLDVTGNTRTSGKLYIGTSGAYFEYDSTNGVHLYVPSGKGFYTEGFVSAGGLSDGGGSEGTTLAEVWTSLEGNSGYGANKKIHTAHLPFATTAAAGAVIVGDGLSITNGVLSATNAGTITSVTKGTDVAGGAVTTNGGAVTIQFPSLSGYVPTTRTVNGKALSSNITLSLDDVADGSTRKLANYLPLTAGSNNTLTGALYISTSSVYSLYVNSTGTSGAGIRFQVGGTTLGSLMTAAGDNELYYNSNKIYHAGNSGISSNAVTLNNSSVGTASAPIGYSLYTSRFKRYEGTAAAGGYDLNTMLPGGGITSQYNNSSYWSHGPTGMSYGGVVQFNPNVSDSLALQLAWDIVHDTSSPDSGNLWFRGKTAVNGGTWGGWKKLWHDGNSNKSDVAWACSTLTASGNATIAGNVGIGTTSPGYKLDVNGTARVTTLKIGNGAPTLTWDANAGTNGAWHLSGSLYADGFISAGGVSPDSGTSGIDPLAMWKLLTNNDALTNYGDSTKIHTAHLPTLSAGTGLTASYTQTSATSTTLNLGIDSGYKLPTTTEWGSKADASALGDYVYKAGANTMTGNLTITRSGSSHLIINRTDGLPWITFQKNGTTVGNIGVNDNNEPYFHDTTTSRLIYHSGNFTPGDYLPKSGGTISNPNGAAFPLTIDGTSSSASFVGLIFSISGTINARLIKYADVNGFKRTDSAWTTEYLIYDSGNFSVTLNGSKNTAASFYAPTASGTTGQILKATTNGAPVWTSSALGASNKPVYLNSSGVLTEGDSCLKLSGGTLTGALTINYPGIYSIYVNNNSSGATSSGIRFQVGGTTYGSLSVSSSTELGYNGNIVYHAGNSNSTTSGQWAATSLALAGAISGATNIDSLVYLDTTNTRVGIGVSSPTERLDIRSGASYARLYKFYHTDNQENGGYLGCGSSASRVILQASSGYDLFFYTQGALSGYWTSSGLTITSTTLTLGDSTGANFYMIRPSANYIWANAAGGYLVFGVKDSGSAGTATRTLVVNQYGIGVGKATEGVVASSTYALNVAGSTYMSGSLAVAGNSASFGNSSSCALYFKRPLINYFVADQTGGYFVFRVNGSATNVMTLGTNGNLSVTGAVTAGAASDARLKTNINTMSDEQAKALIMALRPVTFTWNQKATELNDEYNGNDLGFVAQEVEGVQNMIPGLSKAFGTIFTEYKRLDPVKFIAPIIKVEQDHERRIAALENENKMLKEEIKRLRS